jgi:hypothetical protein
MPLGNRYPTFPWIHFMEPRAVARFFTLKGMSPTDIHTGLEFVYMSEALCLCTIYKCHECFVQERTELCDDPPPGRPLQNDLADTRLAMIQEFSFTSCKRLCIQFRVANSTCLGIWYDVLRLAMFNLGTVPHSRWRSKGRTGITFHRPFESSQRRSKERLCSSYNRRWIMTLFRLSSSVVLRPVQRWCSRNNQTSDCHRKSLMSVIWSVNGIRSLLEVPKGTRDNSTFFCDVVMPDMLKNVCTQPKTEPERNLDVCWQCASS